jgi:2-pyrone-4,6-dicarboxylate lactonase
MATDSKEFDLPEGSCDCHLHIYGPYDRFPLQSEGRFSPTQEHPVEALFAMWDTVGIARGVIVHTLVAGHDNEVTLDALRRFPKRLRAVAMLSREVGDRRLNEMTDAGFRGVRLMLLRQDGKKVATGGIDLDDLKALAPRLAERGWHAQLWIETGDLDELAPELEKLPLNFVIDHMGRTMTEKGIGYPGFQRLCDRLKSGRYWCKLSGADRSTRQGTPFGDTEPFMQALVKANPERVVWGTDWPHVGHTPESLPKDADLIRLFYKCLPDAALRRKVLVDNPARLYGF